MDRNSKKWSQKGYHSLPFAAKLSVRRSFEQFHALNNGQGNFPNHSIPTMSQNHHAIFIQIKGFFDRL